MDFDFDDMETIDLGIDLCATPEFDESGLFNDGGLDDMTKTRTYNVKNVEEHNRLYDEIMGSHTEVQENLAKTLTNLSGS